MVVAHLGIVIGWRPGWTLFGLDYDPAIVIHRLQLADYDLEVNTALRVAGHCKGAARHRIKETSVGGTHSINHRLAYILEVHMVHAIGPLVQNAQRVRSGEVQVPGVIEQS